MNRIKGNVAHDVISGLCDKAQEGERVDAAVLRQIVEESYDQLFDEVVQRHGAILPLPENELDRQFLKIDLKECLGALASIMERNHLHVFAAESSYNDNLSYPEDITIYGRVDMIMQQTDGELFVMDFKWSESNFYQGSLEQNVSLQLSVYQELIAQQLQRKVAGVGYFLLPRGKLYTTAHLIGADVVEPQDTADNSLRIRNSYAFRRNQITSGIIETDQPNPLTALEYGTQVESHQLFPLTNASATPAKGEAVKQASLFSPYSLIKE